MHIPFLSKKTTRSLLLGKKIDKKTTKPTFYPVCPKCLNPNLKPVKEFTSGWLTTPRYYCPMCQYSGLLVLEIDITLFETKTLNEIRKMFLEEELEVGDDFQE